MTDRKPPTTPEPHQEPSPKPYAKKQLGSLGPVDLWLRRGSYLCVFLVVVKIAFLLFSDAWGHAHFSFEKWPGFFEALGFLGFALLVVIGRLMGPWVRRPEDYYDPELAEASPHSGAESDG